VRAQQVCATTTTKRALFKENFNCAKTRIFNLGFYYYFRVSPFTTSFCGRFSHSKKEPANEEEEEQIRERRERE